MPIKFVWRNHECRKWGGEGSVALLNRIGEKNVIHKKYLEHNFCLLTESEHCEFELVIDYFKTLGETLATMTDAYLTFLNDTNEEFQYFVENKKYRYSKIHDVAYKVYHDELYMHKYMLGLVLSHYLWVNHLYTGRFFCDKIKGLKGYNYLEVGPGFGEYFCKAMFLTDIMHYEAIDISQTSVEGAKRFINHFAKEDLKDYNIHCCDFFEYEVAKKVDVFVMMEVLEHVERPDLFLKKIKTITHKGSFIFITTVINAPEIDHIYLFSCKEEVFSVVKECGFTVSDYYCVAANDIPLPKAERKQYPITISLVLAHDIHP